MSKVSYEFRVAARTKTETENGDKFRVKLKNDEGHSLTLVSDSEAIFAGYPFGVAIIVDIRKHMTLEPGVSV